LEQYVIVADIVEAGIPTCALDSGSIAAEFNGVEPANVS
jgi:hypothetical protein